MSALTSTLATTSWRLPLGRLKRGGSMAVMAACKLALLFSMLESAGQAAELNCEALESLKIETANLLEAHGAASRTMLARKPAVRCLCRAPGLAGRSGERMLRSSLMAGHRLPNGLCAPMQC